MYNFTLLVSDATQAKYQICANLPPQMLLVKDTKTF